MLGEAVSTFGIDAEGTIVVHGGGSFLEAIVVDGGRTLAILANGGDLPIWALPGGGSSQLVIDDATVLIDGLQLSGNASTADPALRVDGGRAWIDRGRIIGNWGGAIIAQNTGLGTGQTGFDHLFDLFRCHHSV